ncbi:MAG: hypothetical protein ACYC2G_16630 [Gemmatimonadaceae bacterium]
MRQSARSDPLRVSGAAILYRLHDVGYGIAIERVLDLLAAQAPERVRPVRGEGQAIQIPNPPISVILGTENVAIGSHRLDAEVSARIFDFGVVSLRVRIDTPGEMSWQEFSEFGNQVDADGLQELFAHHLRLLVERIHPAIQRPKLSPVSEDYVVYRVNRLLGADGKHLTSDALRDADVVPLLLNENRPLSVDARRELLPNRFSYYADDLAILTWDNALVVEPTATDTDVQYILEFANAQLLELRYYDAMLDGELPRMYDRIAALRGRAGTFLGRRFAPLLAELQSMVADSTELVERVENSLKVTDDVYLARIYTAALEIFRGRAWRAGIDRKLAIIRDTYAMLNGEAQSRRAEALELAIVLLIVAEIVMALAS